MWFWVGGTLGFGLLYGFLVGVDLPVVFGSLWFWDCRGGLGGLGVFLGGGFRLGLFILRDCLILRLFGCITCGF